MSEIELLTKISNTLDCILFVQLFFFLKAVFGMVFSFISGWLD